MKAFRLARPALWLALVAVVTASGWTGWKLRESARLARESEPFQAQPVNAVASLLIVGDSTAVGTGASSATRSIGGLIGIGNPQLRVVNRAANGARYEDFARQLQAGTERFDFVLVLGGGNDVIRGTSAEQLLPQARRVAELARERGTNVVLMPPGNVGNAPLFLPPVGWWMSRRAQELHAAVRLAALATGATYVNLYQPPEQDPFARQPGLYHAADGLHPSDAGYRLWLQELDRQAHFGERLASIVPSQS
ncbi:GDSL family lipase [Caenimonas sedimenti]|uniref:GDSL family lipase n=1 Tax=Caenimonas sedimenti TaxID=2596921 RepID=A0A562ZLI6_9BURK|nr:GDSL-type esterase/lipase family protein [Caenimonas sedimenti]TWO69430.1 GDSL family lipase [Caenimonas sedimenti]